MILQVVQLSESFFFLSITPSADFEPAAYSLSKSATCKKKEKEIRNRNKPSLEIFLLQAFNHRRALSM